MTDIDKELQRLAMADWEKFKALTQLDTTAFEVCSRRNKGKSIRSIARTLKLGAKKVWSICQTCPTL